MTTSRRWLASLPLVVLALACSRQPTATNTSRFAPTPPVIDGQASEWTDSLRYDPGSKLQYQLLNDGRTVYVRLKAADAPTQARLLRQGFVVWLDTTGRNQQQFGVRFPLPGRPNDAPVPADAPTDQPRDRRTRMRQTLAGLREMELLNYKGSKEPTLTDMQSQLGVKLAVGIDEQEDLIYELAVPLRLLYRRLPTLAPGPPAVVGLTVLGNRGTGPVGSPGGSVMDGGRGGMGMRGGLPGGSGMRGGYAGSVENIALKTSAQLTTK